MTPPECKDVKAMLEEINKSVPRLVALYKEIDSGKDIDVIKKTKEALERVLHKHGILRYNLKKWEKRSKKIQRIDKIAEKLKKEGNDADLSVDELHAIHMTEVWKTKDGVFNFKPILDDAGDNHYRYSNLEVCRKNRSEEKQKEDHARIYGCSPEQITSKQDDVFEKNSNIVVFIGEELDFTDQKLPETLKHVSCDLQSASKNAKLPKNLEYVGGYLYLDSLESAKGLELPETVGGSLYLYSLTSAEGLVLPETISGELNLYSLTSAEGLVLPETVGGDLNLRSLESAKGLVLPRTVGGEFFLSSLTSAEGLVLPKTVGGDLYLDSLTSADGLKLPETVGGYLYLRSLESAKGLELPETVGGSLWLSSLTSAEGLEKLNYAGIMRNIWLPKTFSDQDKEEVEKIKTKQREKGISVNFGY